MRVVTETLCNALFMVVRNVAFLFLKNNLIPQNELSLNKMKE